MSKPADKFFNHATGSPAQESGTTARIGSPDALIPDSAQDIPDGAPRTDFPCSVAQERFWLLDRLDPGNASYNVAVRWRLDGRVSTAVLERAWLAIIERHEILRTLFFERDGAPVQRIMPQSPFKLAEIDLSALAQDQQQAEGDRIGVMEARAPFDLGLGPLIRVTLLRFSATSSIILVTTHQIVSDGWSIGVMAREMGVIYEALCHDKAIALPPLAIQYADYSLWQLEWLKVRGTAAETAYWTKQLAGVRPFKVLPDRVLPAIPTTNGAIVSRVLPRALTTRAQALCAERGATLFAAALAALCATLSRYTRDDEVVLGTQVSDRDQVELEPMIGQFVNSLILRNDLSGNPQFGEMIDRVRETSMQALEHRHIPIERLLGMVKAERSQANSPPISVNFIFQKTFIQNTTYADFSLIDLPSLPAGAIYDLNFFMVERPDGWRFSCQYNTDQFERATAERLLAYIERLLESAVARPSLRLSELTLCSHDEAHRLLAKLNDTRALYPRDLTIGQLFEVQVARAPEAVAVSCGDKTLTYGEVNASANRVAAYLQRQGIGPGSRVGVCLPRSVDLPICLLAILKTGATFVPLEPADPPVRLADMIRISGTTTVIGRGLERAAVAHIPVHLTDADDALKLGSELLQPAAVRSDAIACAVVVPGSDDGSRVVAISHRNLTNLIYSLAKRPGVNDRDVIVAGSPVSTSRAAVEMLLPLLTGARLVVAADKDLAGGRALLHLLQRAGATLMFAAPPTWIALLEANWIGYPALKMLCSAEELSARLIDRLSAIGGELWSMFGQPETGVWSATRLVKSKELPGVLGEPIANTTLQVLEPSLQLAPVGAVGELHIGGDGLTERALAGCVTAASGALLYPTGNLARLLASGRIEYLGRLDDRFPYRGRTIDPAEIERLVMQRHPGVAEVAIAQLKDAAGEGAIGAFVVARDPAAQTADLIAELQKTLAESLPSYMVPSVIAVRESLPHLRNGAVDRRALSLSKGRTGRGAVQQRPAGDIERRLAAIWASMLGLESVDGGDNFFELGGHSLLAARMLTRVEREFGRRIKLATLFLAPTLQDFAAILAHADLREFDFRQVVKIQPHGSKRPLIAINNTGVYYGLAKNLGSEQPVYSLQLFDPSLRESPLPDTLEEIAAGYVALIRRVQPHGPYDLMGWCVAGALAFEIARQLAADKQEVSRLFLVDSWVPGYYKRLPKLRGLVATYSLRAQLVAADLRRVLSNEKSLWAFITQRTIFKRLQRIFRRAGRSPDAPAGDALPNEEPATPEIYDQWLLAYLQRLSNSYTPKPYAGAVTLLRSRLEPTGWLFDQDAGWAAYATSGVDVRFVDGDHFTMFQEPGSHQMAAHVAAAMEKPTSLS